MHGILVKEWKKLTATSRANWLKQHNFDCILLEDQVENLLYMRNAHGLTVLVLLQKRKLRRPFPPPDYLPPMIWKQTSLLEIVDLIVFSSTGSHFTAHSTRFSTALEEKVLS